MNEPYYRRDLALVHHRGFGFHADLCAPGIVELLEPVRERNGLVLEVAFEGLNRSTRHKSGVAMRFPRISRLRWDKPAAEADRIETLQALLDR